MASCDGDGDEEGFFRRRRVGGVAPQQDIAARPMQFRFERAKTGALGRRQRLVEGRDGAVEIARAGFALGHRNFEEPVEKQDVLLAKGFDAAAHALESRGGRAGFGGRPAFEKHPERAEQGQIVLADDASEFGDARPGARAVAAHQCEQGGVHRAEGERAGAALNVRPRALTRLDVDRGRASHWADP